MNATQTLDREYLEIRARILEIAACLDRIDRSEGDCANDPRLQLLMKAIGQLSGDRDDRAEQVQMIFSRSYDHDWQEQFQLSKSTS